MNTDGAADPLQVASHGVRIMTKRSLAAMSHTLERTAAELGSSATVLSMFQYETYFLPRARTFDELKSLGTHTVVAYNGSGHTDDHHVVLDVDDPLTTIWVAVLVSDTFCGYVYADDIVEFSGDTAGGLESARLFRAEVGFDPARTVEIAHTVVGDLQDAGLPAAAADRVRGRIDGHSRVERVATCRAWAAGMELMSRRLERVSTEWRGERAKAGIDPLTGLANREGLHRWSGTSGDAKLPNPPIGVLLFDMADFKAVNDTIGHEAGDEMLTGVADAIKRTIRSQDLAVRWGGDEFVVLCPGTSDDEELRAMGDRIAGAVSEVSVAGMHAVIDFGVDVCSERPVAFDVADAAMYESKRSRRRSSP